MDRIDINCDMGESFGNFRIGNDAAVFPYITSSNIACGFHAGDPMHMEQTVAMALAHKVQIGAHPGYPDLQGFGRRSMKLTTAELKSMVKYQVAALKGMTESLGGALTYVKPHGALYNDAAKNRTVATAIMDAVLEIDDQLLLMGLSGSEIGVWASAKSIGFIAEAFADRRYEPTGSLRSRSLEDAVIEDAREAAEQVLQIVRDQKVKTYDGSEISLIAESICIHGDNPNVIALLQEIDQVLQEHDIRKTQFERP